MLGFHREFAPMEEPSAAELQQIKLEQAQESVDYGYCETIEEYLNTPVDPPIDPEEEVSF